jgi:hypothetical protein
VPPDTNPEDMAALVACGVSFPYADFGVLVVSTVMHVLNGRGQPEPSRDSAVDLALMILRLTAAGKCHSAFGGPWE